MGEVVEGRPRGVFFTVRRPGGGRTEERERVVRVDVSGG